jgi:putative glutamine amidotransferase
LRPLIGITTGTHCLHPAQCEAGYEAPQYFTNQPYARAIAVAGGAPILIPAITDDEVLRGVFDYLHGIVFSGGPDIDPARYREGPIPECGIPDPAMDTAELRLARWCLESDRPLLAICRGQQVVNVALGGTLFQDISSQVPGSLVHHPRDQRRCYIVHNISIEPRSRLASILQCQSIGVNSMHHQAIKTVGDGLMVTAHAPDGTIEGVESAEHRFVVAVQFHPEELQGIDERMRRLFTALVQQSAVGTRGD